MLLSINALFYIPTAGNLSSRLSYTIEVPLSKALNSHPADQRAAVAEHDCCPLGIAKPRGW